MSDPQDVNETVFDNDSEGHDDTLSLQRIRHVSSPGIFKPLLVCLEGPHRGMRFPLQKREQIIGRGSQADIRIEEDDLAPSRSCHLA